MAGRVTQTENGEFQARVRNALGTMNKSQLEDLVYNVQLQRKFFQEMFKDQRRNIYNECGYPATQELTAEMYHDLYEREPIAARTVDIYPDECWQVTPELYETEDEENETEFELAWKELGKQFRGDSKWQDETNNPLWAYLHRADKLCGVGRYGCILLGVNDGGRLEDPLEEGGTHELMFMRVLDEALCQISSVETDQTNERFDRPVFYNVGLTTPSQVTTPQIKTQRVHYTRIVHIADNLQTDETLGIPRMQRAYNRLYDLNKLYGGSAEMYWQGAFPGLSFETHPQLGGQVKMDTSSMKEQLERYFTGLQRYLSFPGGHVNALSPQVSDPSNHIDKEIEAICIMLNVPKRIFMGSERGELASSQDAKRWIGQCHFRQQRFITPGIIVPFIDHLIRYGILPEPKEYFVHWPDAAIVTDQEEAQVAKTRIETLSLYAQSNIPSVITPLDAFTKIMGMDKAEAQEMLDNADAEMEDSVMQGIYATEEDIAQQQMLSVEQAQKDNEFNQSSKPKKGFAGEKTDESMTSNAFCPTGEGGGQDNSCSSKDGKGAEEKPKKGRKRKKNTRRSEYENVSVIDSGDDLPSDLVSKLKESEDLHRVIFDTRDKTWHINEVGMNEGSETHSEFAPSGSSFDLDLVRGMYDPGSNSMTLYDVKDNAIEIAGDNGISIKAVELRLEKNLTKAFDGSFKVEGKLPEIDQATIEDLLGNEENENSLNASS